VRQAADAFGPGSTALSMRKVAERALEVDDEEVPTRRARTALAHPARRERNSPRQRRCHIDRL